LPEEVDDFLFFWHQARCGLCNQPDGVIRFFVDFQGEEHAVSQLFKVLLFWGMLLSLKTWSWMCFQFALHIPFSDSRLCGQDCRLYFGLFSFLSVLLNTT
jgi:hypothetical protein